MDKKYISSVITVICMLMLFLIVFSLSSGSKQLDYKENYIKINNNVISVPNYLLSALLYKYRNRLINYSQIQDNLDYSKLLDIERSLSNHIYFKYKIKFDMNPVVLEKYIINQGIPQKNNYDNELTGGYELSDKNKCLGKIVWLLEQLIILNKTSDNIEIPINLENIDNMLENPIYNPRIINHVPEDMPLDTIVEIDEPQQWRKPSKSTPIECSKNLRNNLQNYISDSACNDIYNDDITSVIKNKISKDTANGWEPTLLKEMSNTTQPRGIEFTESNNRFIKQEPSYKNHNLSLSLMKYDSKLNNHKQSLTIAWDYLENEFLSH
jgi:hypothetical protein